jgi:hypothetical protein
MPNYIRILILAFVIVCILSLLGCPGAKKGTSTNGKKPEMSKDEVNVNGQPVNVPPGQVPENAGQGSAGLGTDESLGTPVTGYKATQEHPLAPGAPPASGSEKVKDGEVKLVISATGSDGKQVSLIEGATIPVSDNMKVQISLVNKTKAPYVIHFMTSQKTDILMNDLRGKQVYKWSEGLRFAQVLDDLTVQPGDTWAHEITVQVGKGEHKISPGTYAIIVTLPGDPVMTAEAKIVTIVQG